MDKTTNNCVNCGKEIKHCLYPLCPDCHPYKYSKGKEPHQNVRTTQKWKEAREKRLSESHCQCDWCKSSLNNTLTIHHKKGMNYKTYETIWETLIEEKGISLIESDNKWKKFWDDLWSGVSLQNIMDKIQKEHLIKKKGKKMQTCPSCGRASLTKRKVKKPKYRCGKCGKEFSKPIYQIPYHYYLTPFVLKKRIESQIKNQFNNEIIKKCYDELYKRYQEEVNKYVEDYLSMKDTLVLCKKCHFAIEQGKALCPECKQHYFYPLYKTCISCQNSYFFEQNKAYYIIEESNDYYIIRSIYDKNLIKIIKELWYGKKWDPKNKIWLIEKSAFHIIQKKVLDYFASSDKVYNLNYVRDEIYNDVKEGIKNNKNYREKLLAELPECKDETEGYCNHAGAYYYGDKIKCDKLYCDGYFPIDEDYNKLTEIITKLHIIDNVIVTMPVKR